MNNRAPLSMFGRRRALVERKDYTAGGAAYRSYDGRTADVLALVDICLRASPTARIVRTDPSVRGIRVLVRIGRA